MLYTLLQYIRYRLKAKTRHGIHSPFVYSFIENGLMQMKGDVVAGTTSYFADWEVQVADIGQADEIESAIAVAGARTVQVIKNIHNTSAATKSWDALRTDDRVMIDIDLYSTGLLFFNEDIKEKQSFILKYPYK